MVAMHAEKAYNTVTGTALSILHSALDASQ